MENTILTRTRRFIIAAALASVILTATMMTVKADGNLLRGFDVPMTVPSQSAKVLSPAIYWPIGVTFDGRNLWYSQPCDCTSGIFLSSTSGVLLNTLHEVKEAGALAWDGSNLWVGSFPNKATTCTSGSTGCAFLTKVDVNTGSPIGTIDLSSIFAADQECSFIDGLSFDSTTGTFWVSPDIGCLSFIVPNACAVGFVYNVDSSGHLLKRIQMNFGVAGVDKVGASIYMVNGCTRPRSIVQTTTDGTVVSTFPTISVSGQRERAESIAFDPVTFAPNCALWAVQDYGFFPLEASLAAYQIACP